MQKSVSVSAEAVTLIRNGRHESGLPMPKKVPVVVVATTQASYNIAEYEKEILATRTSDRLTMRDPAMFHGTSAGRG